MKKSLFIVLTIIFLPQMAYADIYTKADAMGMGNVETWISGKKKREVTNVSVPGMPPQTNIVITRLDKDVEWTVDEALQVYEEKQVHISNTPSETEYTKDEAEMTDKFEKVIDAGEQGAKEICAPDLLVLPQREDIAGFQATGYRSRCPQGTPTTTVWISPPNGILDQYEKENTAFEKAHQELLFKEYNSREDKLARKLLGVMGSAMSQGLLGIRADKLPKGVALRMEQTGDMGDGVMRTNRMVDIQEIRVEKADVSLFEIPAGFKKVSNLAELQSEHMMRQMGMGGMVDEMKVMQASMPSDNTQAQSYNYETPQEEAPQEEQPQEETETPQANPDEVVYED